jgi:ribosome biogenesis protein Tsr3
MGLGTDDLQIKIFRRIKVGDDFIELNSETISTESQLHDRQEVVDFKGQHERY